MDGVKWSLENDNREQKGCWQAHGELGLQEAGRRGGGVQYGVCSP